MIFAICNPVIASEAQIGLALRILCGFGIDEIADAFLSNKETINKRLFRAREKLRTEKVRLEMPLENEIANRLDNVLHIIYLLFNEGYYSTSHNQVLRKDLCLEALRLALILTEYKNTNIPKTNALIALMCFHTSRYDARQNNENSIILYEHQNEQLWNKDLINKGNHYLALSANGNEISSYHLEAGIAFWHCQKEETVEKWNRILEHYNMLLEINYSRTVALNRIYAIYKAKGSEIALEEAEKLQFTSSHFYYTLLGELYKEVDTNSALLNYEKAFSMAKTQVDKQLLKSKIENIKINF
jgi:predicted RNA polymerase sigma factor